MSASIVPLGNLRESGDARGDGCTSHPEMKGHDDDIERIQVIEQDVELAATLVLAR